MLGQFNIGIQVTIMIVTPNQRKSNKADLTKLYVFDFYMVDVISKLTFDFYFYRYQPVWMRIARIEYFVLQIITTSIMNASKTCLQVCFFSDCLWFCYCFVFVSISICVCFCFRLTFPHAHVYSFPLIFIIQRPHSLYF